MCFGVWCALRAIVRHSAAAVINPSARKGQFCEIASWPYLRIVPSNWHLINKFMLIIMIQFTIMARSRPGTLKCVLAARWFALNFDRLQLWRIGHSDVTLRHAVDGQIAIRMPCPTANNYSP